MIVDKNRIFDGWISLEGGVDAGRSPDMIAPNQSESAINMTFRGGSVTTRPGFRKLDEQFPDILDQVFVYNQPFDSTSAHRITGEYTGVEGVPFLVNPPNPPAPPSNLDGSETIYRTGKFQCASAYSPHHGEDCIVAMIGGRMFRIVPKVTTSSVTEIIIDERLDPDPPSSPPAQTGQRRLRNDQSNSIAYMCQADKWMLIQDGDARPILYDGSTARRSITTDDPNKSEVPVGTIMAYGMGRIIVIVNERDVAFGDLYGSHDLPDPADSLVLFTERNFLAEGFDAAIPFQQGVATGAVFFPQLDTSTGNGQLMVFAERGAASFFLSLPREEWKASQFQILSLLTTGLRGHRSIAVANEDLWFRSDDGMRSYRQARSESTGWPHIPQSTNVKQFLNNDSGWMLKYASAIYFDNRVLVTTSPMPNQERPIHVGLMSVDFDILSSFGQNSQPAWDGQWVMPGGYMILQVLSGTFDGITRAFMFCLGPDNQNYLFEFSKDDKDDWDGQRITWELVTRAFDFEKLEQASTPFTENEIYDADIWMKEIVE